MTFTLLCVGLVVTLVILAASAAFGWITSWMSDDTEMWSFIAWMVTAIGFAVCLTIILVSKGLIT